MKTSTSVALLSVVIVAVAAGAFLVAVVFPSDTAEEAVRAASTPATAPEPEPRSPGERAPAELLTVSLQELERAIVDLSARVERLERARRDVGEGGPARREPEDTNTPSGVDAHWFLERYVASFHDGGKGDEYYRLGVQANVVELLPEIVILVRNGRQYEELRARLAEMLGDERFRGDARALDALFTALMDPDAPRLALAALKALTEIGDLAVAQRLASVVWTIEDASLRQQVLLRIVQVAGVEANGLLRDLFASAVRDRDRIFVLALLAPSAAEVALEVIESASFLSHDVRLAAAEKVGSFYGPETLALIEAWLVYEREADVRAALGGARDEANTVPDWHPLQATGAPDADPSQYDDERAWAPKSKQMGAQWIELTYQPALRAQRVRVFEINGGVVTGVTLFFEGGGQQVVLPGGQKSQSHGELTLEFPATSQRVARIRVVVDTDARPGWNEIDAVELSGPDGAGYAVHAIASSSFAH